MLISSTKPVKCCDQVSIDYHTQMFNYASSVCVAFNALTMMAKYKKLQISCANVFEMSHWI